MSQTLQNSFDRLAEILKNNNSFIIVGHERPDGYCIGTQYSLGYLLESWDKQVYLSNPDPPPTNMDFLTTESTWRVTIPDRPVDVGIVIDCGNLQRTANFQPYLEGLDRLVVIDHHQNNHLDVDLKILCPEISSVGEIVFRFYQHLGETITPAVARALYASIVTDTGCFRHGNTTALTHQAVARLMEAGDFHTEEIYSLIYERESLQSRVLLGEILTGLQQRESVVWSQVTGELFRRTGTSEDDLNEAINQLRQVEGAKIVILFCERPDSRTVKVSFRSKQGIDLMPIVSRFGGGGHSAAAGASVQGSLSEVKDKVLQTVDEVLNRAG